MTTQSTKFALYNFAGHPVSYYKAEPVELPSSDQVRVQQPSHHIIVVDRSGSMYGDIPELRSMMAKLLTINEFNKQSLRVSLISYSSSGDVKLHFSKVHVNDMMRVGSPYMKEIQSINSTGMTCISQAMKMAAGLIDDSEITCISLHSDGYANDPSPHMDVKNLHEAVNVIKQHHNVFCNTVAYRQSCDYNLLSMIANQLSGSCIQATSINQVYEALYSTTEGIAGQMAPVIEIPIGGAQYVLFVSESAQKVLGSHSSLVVNGLSKHDDRLAWRLFEITEQDYKKSKLPVAGGDKMPATTLLTFCRAMLAEGKFNTAKYALISTRLRECISDHARALTSQEIAAMAADVERLIFINKTFGRDSKIAKFGLEGRGPSVLDFISVLNSHCESSEILVDVNELLDGYKRRGMKTLDGIRDKITGQLIPPNTNVKPRNGSPLIKIQSFEFNNSDATINMLTTRPVDLIEKATGTVIPEVGGIKLDNLKVYRNYTIIGDGVLNVSNLSLVINDKRVIADLNKIGVISGTGPEQSYRLDKMPIIKYDQDFSHIGSAEVVTDIDNLVGLTILSKILTALERPKAGGFKYTSEQLEALTKHNISSRLYYSPPSCSAHPILNEAVNQGDVDVRLTYKVTIGNRNILNTNQLWSGNEYFQRRFVVKVNGKVIPDAKISAIYEQGASVELKQLTGRTKLNAIDDITFPIYESFFGISHNNANLVKLYDLANIKQGIVNQFFIKLWNMKFDDEFLSVLHNMKTNVNRAIEDIYANLIRPITFYIGASGIIPDGLLATSMDSEQLMKKFPPISLDKSEMGGTFFLLNNELIISVFTERDYYTTQAYFDKTNKIHVNRSEMM